MSEEEQEYEYRQTTIEAMFCNQIVAPQIQEFFSAIESYRENHPKSHRELQTFINTVDSHLNDFRDIAKDATIIAESMEKYDTS